MSKRAWAGAVVTAIMLLNGCGGGFFVDSTSSSSSTSTTGDYVYAVNSTTNAIYEYSIGSAALTAISGSPLTAVSGLAAASVAVSRANTFVYVGGLGTISSYTIGSTGALTVAAQQAASVQSSDFTALRTSPDGQWLLAMDALTPTVYVFKINTSTGALTLNQAATYVPSGSGTFTPRSMSLAPAATFLAVALGADGDVIFTFNTSTGTLNAVSTVGLTSSYSDNAVQFDGTSGYLFIARGATTTGASLLAAYTVNGNGSLTSGATLAAGNAPYALLLESTGSYLYAANRSDATVSSYGIATGALTALSGSPSQSATLPSAMVEDNSHAYVVSAGAAGGVDLTLYKLDALTSGKLDAVATATSGATGLTAVAATHGSSGTIQ